MGGEMQTLLNPAFNKVVLKAGKLFDYRDDKALHQTEEQSGTPEAVVCATPGVRVTTLESEPCPKLNRVGTEENVPAGDGPKGAIGNISWVENGCTSY